ncbi:MAG TPA: M14 metallopeptidase family protein [Pyrinomonadaceae bacterium]|jgi:murein tripeptide amidase MpaA
MRTRSLALSLIIISILSLSSLARKPALDQYRAQAAAPARSLASALNPHAQASVPAPEDVLGFRPGDDRKLAGWSQVVEYFQRLDAASERVKFEELGKTTKGAPFVMATISAPENLARLNEYKKIQDQLADPRRLGRQAERKAAALVKRGKTIVLITCGIHSTEVGSYLSSMLIAHRLASSDDARVRAILQNTIILLVPSLNPDGVDIVKNWYDRTLGTPYEGTDPPELYHEYTGHDNNRDWYAFTQVETQITVDKIHNVWHPQIVHDIHQQGAAGSRLFLPPYMQPVEPNVPRQLVEAYTELGNAMAAELRASGFQGITTNSTYDAWTPARAYSHYHGGVRILSETASAKLATPITLKFEELRSREGYDPQKESANFGPVWRGGQWRLRDITNYMTTAAFSLLNHASQNRARWLSRFYEIGKEAVRPRRAGELYAYLVLPDHPTSDKLLDILRRAQVEVDYAQEFISKDGPVPEGTAVIKMAQPFGSFAKALLERQRYPNLLDVKGNPIAPYDVTAHTLPLLMGLEVRPLYQPFRYQTPKEITSGFSMYHWKGSKRLALYKSHIPALDEGWTRWVLENSLIDYASLEDREIRGGNLRAKYDTIVIPDQSPRAILEGYRRGSMPEEYTGGLGAEGVKSLREFIEQGGTLVCLNRASDFAIEQFKLPVRDVTEGLSRKEFYAPGSILRFEVNRTLNSSPPEVKGLRVTGQNAWVEDSPAFEIKSDPAALARVRIIARYPTDSDPLLSGWLLGGERLRGKALLMEVSIGQGHVYLFGFRPQYRGQSVGTYPLFFNVIAPPGN